MAGCGKRGLSDGPANNEGQGTAGNSPSSGTWQFKVDIDQARLDIVAADNLGTVASLNGHTVEIRNGAAGCTWDGLTSTLHCEVEIFNRDSNECMWNVRTRLHHSQEPSAIVNGADYTWPGPTVCNGTTTLPQNRGNCSLPISEFSFL